MCIQNISFLWWKSISSVNLLYSLHTKWHACCTRQLKLTKKNDKNWIMLEWSLASQKNYKIIKRQKNVLYFDRYTLSVLYVYTNALLASAHMSDGWFVNQCQTSQIVVQHTVKWWSCDFCFISFVSFWFSDISDHLIFLINTRPSVPRTSYWI